MARTKRNLEVVGRWNDAETTGSRRSSEDRRAWIPYTVTGDIELRIDISALLKVMGEKALRTKSGRTTSQRGIIVVTAKNRQES